MNCGTIGTIASSYRMNVTDPDARAFLIAAGISNQQQQIAVDNLVIAAKANGWWTLCNAIYPIVGGSAFSHKFNLKDPRDLDAAFRLNFQGGWTHSATGANPNGTNAYADTFVVPSTALNLNDVHGSYYSRDNTAFGSEYVIGAFQSGIQEFGLIIRRSGGDYFSILYDETVSLVNGTLADGSGWFLASRASITSNVFYRNGVSVNSNSLANAGTRPTISVYLAALNNMGAAQSFSDKECAFASLGSGISGALSATMYSDIQTFETALERQV